MTIKIELLKQLFGELLQYLIAGDELDSAPSITFGHLQNLVLHCFVCISISFPAYSGKNSAGVVRIQKGRRQNQDRSHMIGKLTVLEFL